MAKKEYDPCIEQGKDMRILNTRILNYGWTYFIHDGMVYMNSAIPGIDRWIALEDRRMYNAYEDLAISTAPLRTFFTSMRKTKTTITRSPDSIFLGNIENGTRLELKRLNEEKRDRLIQTFYHKMFVKPDFTQNVYRALDHERGTPFSDEEIAILEEKIPINVEIPDNGSVYLQKSLFGPLKNTEWIRIYPVSGENSLETNLLYGKCTALIVQKDPWMTIYTLLSYLKAK